VLQDNVLLCIAFDVPAADSFKNSQEIAEEGDAAGKPPMKTKYTRLNAKTADALERIAEANRASESSIIALAVERLVAEVRETGRLPVPVVDLSDESPDQEPEPADPAKPA